MLNHGDDLRLDGPTLEGAHFAPLLRPGPPFRLGLLREGRQVERGFLDLDGVDLEVLSDGRVVHCLAEFLATGGDFWQGESALSGKSDIDALEDRVLWSEGMTSSNLKPRHDREGSQVIVK